MKMPKTLLTLTALLVTSGAVASESEGMDAQTCPANFNSVKIPTDGKLCQIFAADFPASMIMHVPQSPESVVSFYQQDPEVYPIKTEVKSRVMLQSADKNTTLIISSDGEGAQVDILVKGSDTSET